MGDEAPRDSGGGFLKSASTLCELTQKVAELETISRHAARATFRVLKGDVVLMRATGPLTATTIYEFGFRMHELYGAQAVGWIFDYRGALIAASDHDLDRLTRVRHPDSLRRPGAFVIHPDMEASSRAQSVRMALLGFPRRVFLRVDQAAEYVRVEAALRRALLDAPSPPEAP